MNSIHFFLATLPNFALMGVIILVLIALIAGLSAAISNPNTTAKATRAAKQKSTSNKQSQTQAAHKTCDLYDVPDETAAMIMAIVADGLREPLDNIRFISIKEI